MYEGIDHGSLSIRRLITQQNAEDMNRMGRMEGLKDNAVAARDFPEKTLVALTLQGLYQTAKRIIGKLPNIVQDSVAPVGWDPLKLFCGVAVNVYEPSHTRVGPG